MSRCHDGWNSTSSMRWPYLSWVRSSGSLRLASSPHRRTSSEPASRPMRCRSSTCQAAPSRSRPASRTGSAATSWPNSGGGWLVTSCVLAPVPGKAGSNSVMPLSCLAPHRLTRRSSLSSLSFADKRLLVICAVLAAAAGLLNVHPVGKVLPFLVSALALAALASLVGTAVDALGDRLGAGATGVVQSALGNLPELFVCIFALRAGLDEVVRAAIVGSILSNVLLVLGLAFIVGGVKHGVQRFAAPAARNIGMLLLLAVAALMLPALTDALHSPAEGHELAFSRVVAVVLLLVFALSLPAALARSDTPVTEDTDRDGHVRAWPLW